MQNRSKSDKYTVDKARPFGQPTPTDFAAFPGKDQLWWPAWQALFEDGQSVAGVNHSSVTRHLDSPGSSCEAPWTPDTEMSPDESPAVFPPSATSPASNQVEPIHEGRASKRKAQNRAAQRAHRERQRVRLKGLHDKIEKLQARCKQLQTRNQLLEATFHRIFRDAVILLGTRDNARTVELETDHRLSDEDNFISGSSK